MEEKRAREEVEVAEASHKTRRVVGDVEECHLGHRFVDKAQVAAVSTALVAWYSRKARALPWRVVTGESVQHRAYKIWVSEVMLQQSQVAAVVPFYERFISKWSTLDSLALATQEEVNAVWSGLGFYRRAKMLLEGAQQVTKDFGGVIPSTSVELKKLRGVGQYTAGAIASIAFGEKAPIVDGNVVRVVSRMRAIGGNPKAKLAVKKHWELAGELVEASDNPSHLNQSLMELGATVCTKANPNCGECPVREHCWAVQKEPAWKISECACPICGDWKPEEGQEGPARFPAKKPKIKKSDMAALCLILEVDGKYVLTQRPAKGLLAGLREFPTSEWKDRSSLPSKAVQAAARAAILAKCFVEPVNIGSVDTVGEFEHKFSHIDQTMFVQFAQVAAPVALQAGVVAVAAEEIERNGVCKSTNKAFAMLLKKRQKKSAAK